MADDADKTEDFSMIYEKTTSFFFYTKAVWATKVNFLQNLSHLLGNIYG